ncbi:MAG: TraR/DksA family transcriptional regulator [Solirubrobacterales bacterium]
MDPERARQRLAEERTRVEEELARLRGEPTDEEQRDYGDQAAELDQAERDEAIREELEDTLGAIEAAERRLEEGSYGVSVVSGEPIPDDRLELIPWADRKADER